MYVWNSKGSVADSNGCSGAGSYIEKRQGVKRMKRNKEVTIVVDSLIESELINENERARASGVVKEALKKIRAEKYKERQKNC